MQSRWKAAERINTIEAYEEFLSIYPEGELADRSRLKLEGLYFQGAKNTDTIEAYKNFLKLYPEGMHAKEARARLELLNFLKVERTNTIEAYESFLKLYPEGTLANKARAKLELLEFQKAEKINSILSYEYFLSRYSKGELADRTRVRLEALYFQRAKDTNTIESYEYFLELYPKGAHADEALRCLQSLNVQIKAIEEATKRALPKEARVEVTSVSRFPQKPQFLISAHLLEGHSADETSPYVRGDYGTHEKLTRLVRYRCAKILLSIVTGAKLPDASEISIAARHGVRQTYSLSAFSGTDTALTIYQISIPVSKIREHEWSKIKLEEIMELWTVSKNIIPELQFTIIFK